MILAGYGGSLCVGLARCLFGAMIPSYSSSTIGRSMAREIVSQ
jgi:hypothetical protein